ncbi:MAG: hypothetical protein WBB95_22290 [Pseudomonas sp.]|uniref:hypothetical protein n=1 Tax=Pseudomonas sp. TaxID=306 RepID=UPI003C754B3B
MSESLNRQPADVHADHLATWAPAALQVNIDQRQRRVDETVLREVERWVGQQPAIAACQ